MGALTKNSLRFVAIAGLLYTTVAVSANPYLPKSSEAPINIRVGTCGTSGGFIHFYTALSSGLFEKYGIATGGGLKEEE